MYAGLRPPAERRLTPSAMAVFGWQARRRARPRRSCSGGQPQPATTLDEAVSLIVDPAWGEAAMITRVLPTASDISSRMGRGEATRPR